MPKKEEQNKKKTSKDIWNLCASLFNKGSSGTKDDMLAFLILVPLEDREKMSKMFEEINLRGYNQIKSEVESGSYQYC